METHSVSPVFVGRTAELATLREGLERARAGLPQGFVVGGEAGGGKTRLVEEFLAEAGEAGAGTAVGACVELGADGLPFAPVAAVLRALRQSLGAEFARAAAGHEGELARLLPELGEAAPAVEEPERARLFELTTRLLERLAARQPLIVVVEDLHWADRSTRELLGYLVRSLHRTHLLVLATYRTDDIHRRHPLRPLLAELDRLRTVRRIELPPLSRAEVARQIAGITGTAPDPELARSVFARAEGNPFFVEELTVGAARGAEPGGPVGAAVGMSESLREVLLVRVEALPEDAQEVLRVVAEGGAWVEHGLLAEAAGWPEPRLLAALRTAVGAHVLVRAAEGDGYRFRHALMREAVLDDLLPGERARLHRRYAEALEGAAGPLVPENERAARLALHWYRAGDRSRALPATLEAAVRARRRYAYAEQLALLERAMELWDAVPEEVRAGLRPVDRVWGYPREAAADAPLDHPALLAEATSAALLSEQTERASTLSKRALRLLEGRNEPLRTAWFLIQRVRTADKLGRGGDWAELERVQELVCGLPPSVVHAQAEAMRAALLSGRRRSPEALEAAERAVSLARAVGAESTLLYARCTRGSLRVDAGEVTEGLAELEAVLELALEQGEIGQLGRCLVNFAASLARVGLLERAYEVSVRGMELARQYGLEDTVGWLASNHAEELIRLGQWPEAAEALATARRQSRSGPPQAMARALGGRLAVLRGDDATARAELAAARAMSPPAGLWPVFRLVLAWLEVEVALLDGDVRRARAAFAEVSGDGLAGFTSGFTWVLLSAAARAEADTRGLPAAEEGRAAALRLIRSVMKETPRSAPGERAFGLLFEAELLRAEGRDAPGHWAEAVAALEALGLPYDQAGARLRWAESLLAAGGGGRGRAAELLRAARATAERLGAAPLRERVDRLASRAGLALDGPEPRPAAAEPADPFGLTRRERDVLALVAAGRSNRQIAEELFISPKTASVHVSNILAKLEVSGRGEAAALAHRLRLVPAPAAEPGAPAAPSGPGPALGTAQTS